MSARSVFTSESVSMGHPDKLCDQLSDTVLDAVLAEDPQGRVACEALVGADLVVLAGEISSACKPDYPALVQDVVRDVGYTEPGTGFSADECEILVRIGEQSPDIAQGVNTGEGLDKDQGAGDQGMMFGFACDETKELMPMPISLAHRLIERQRELFETGALPWLRPDAKSQVSVEYAGAGRPVRISAVVLSTQHAPDAEQADIEQGVREQIIEAVLPGELLDKDTRIHINPTGRFVMGGPKGDAGLTGRKIIVDTYGGMGRHGGGAFSGKDPTKVDRSAAYAARWVAKNLVAAGLAGRCEVQLAYAIGVSEPVSVRVDSFGTARGPSDETLAELVCKHFDLRPAGIIEELNLRRPIYRKTSYHGHFGREGFPWEDTTRAQELARAAG